MTQWSVTIQTRMDDSERIVGEVKGDITYLLSEVEKIKENQVKKEELDEELKKIKDS